MSIWRYYTLFPFLFWNYLLRWFGGLRWLLEAQEVVCGGRDGCCCVLPGEGWRGRLWQFLRRVMAGIGACELLSGACVWGYQLSLLGWVFWGICLWRGLHTQVATLAEIGLLWVHLGDSTSSLALDAWRPAFVAQCRPGAYLVRQRFLSIAPRLCWFQHGLGFLCKRRRVIISSRRWREHGFWLSRLDRRSWTTSVTRRIHHRRRRSDMTSRRCSHLAQSTFGIRRHQNSTCSILHAVHGIQILLVGILVLVLQFFYISYSIHVASHRLYHLIRSTLVLIFINDWNIFFIVYMLWAFLFHLDGCDEFVS